MNADRAEAAFWAGFLRNRNVEAGTADDGAVPVAGGFAISVAGSLYQMALAVGSTRALTAEDLAVLAAFYGERGAPVRIELREDALARDAALLDAAGYLRDEARITLLEAPAAPVHANGTVRVRATSDVPGWVALTSGCFADEPAAVHVRSAQVGAAAAAALFVAEVDGVPAGGGAVGISGDTAFLYSGCVVPAYRGRGVHAALLRARVAFAASRGAGRVALKALAGSPSERSALRAGFTPVATLRRLHAA
ncbi:MAG TPA: GNAT family N-acetyltransferase [Candidatus Baltobacteraceae bacterium]|nr:GNAT family N-acetyltransferase [Candidatus Baltobacteraceae bacterium]